MNPTERHKLRIRCIELALAGSPAASTGVTSRAKEFEEYITSASTVTPKQNYDDILKKFSDAGEWAEWAASVINKTLTRSNNLLKADSLNKDIKKLHDLAENFQLYAASAIAAIPMENTVRENEDLSAIIETLKKHFGADDALMILPQLVTISVSMSGSPAGSFGFQCSTGASTSSTAPVTSAGKPE